MTGSFTCHCDNTGVERTPNESHCRKLILEKKILSLLLPGLELATFRSRVRRSSNKLSRLPWRYVMALYVVWPICHQPTCRRMAHFSCFWFFFFFFSTIQNHFEKYSRRTRRLTKSWNCLTRNYKSWIWGGAYCRSELSISKNSGHKVLFLLLSLLLLLLLGSNKVYSHGITEHLKQNKVSSAAQQAKRIVWAQL